MAAELMGVNTKRAYSYAMIIAMVTAAIAGALVGGCAGVPVYAGDEFGAEQLQSAAGCEAAEVPLDERAASDQAERQYCAGNADFAGTAGSSGGGVCAVVGEAVSDGLHGGGVGALRGGGCCRLCFADASGGHELCGAGGYRRVMLDKRGKSGYHTFLRGD